MAVHPLVEPAEARPVDPVITTKAGIGMPRDPVGAADLFMLPQERFDDLYTAVYALIDDAKAEYHVVKLYKGSHASPNPHKSVTDFGAWFFERRRGLLGYACDKNRPATLQYALEDLAEFDRVHKPRISTVEAFTILARSRDQPNEAFEDYLNYVADRTHQFGWYRGGSSGFDDEARAFTCAHFRQLGISCDIDDVMIFAGGAKGVFLACCAAFMSHRMFEELHHRGGVVLAPSGYYQSLRLLPPIFGGTLHVEDDLTGETVDEWLTDTEDLPGRVVYVPLVNNLDGRVLSRERAEDIASAIVNHNLDHPHNPAYVIGDDVYVGSYMHDDLDATPIGAIPELALWCVSVVTPSKTFTLPTGRVAFATSRNPAVRKAIAHYRTVFSHGRVPQSSELISAAAISLTPESWIDRWNNWNREHLGYFAREVNNLNAVLGREVFRIEQPEGGWYAPVRVARDLFGERVRSSVDAHAVLLYYGGDDRESGVAMLPGELFGRGCDNGWYTLRANLAVDTGTIARTVRRLHDAASAMLGTSRDHVIGHALSRARRVVPDLDRTIANRRY
ncbi:aminotransferase class I/II-fold pyridoxal phosphate-dependent enzyme [Actinophytocola xanthii]|uniref:Aminotransferase class I/classII large domain-containing protein n=1 Tax=Actinophytocola xanthii TaxID=1912961 RepID=A0A1Q8BXT4_9PSEU|nr:aminotransferase class I/II-fold pyridoxal phosphate-dependent enzyme [Actinophytocola xanthii]OLF06920.1 hypothetical protein BU204_35995 [Actinophytocola xanthii]